MEYIGSKMKKAREIIIKKKPFQIGGLDMWNDIICFIQEALDIELLKLNFKCKQEVSRTFYI